MTALSSTPAVSERAKLRAFLRRDFLVMRSYGLALVSDWLGLIVQLFIFSFVSRIVAAERLPEIGGQRPSYLEFVAVGIAIGAFLQVGLGQLVSVLRDEQLMGTLETLLLSPISLITLQLGSVAFDLVYVPARTALFLALVGALFDVNFHLGALGIVMAVLIVFVPLVWGLGVISAAAVLTFRRGAAITGFAGLLLSVGSGAYFPIELLPGWLGPIMRFNPVAIALQACREALLAGAGWADTAPDMLILAPMAGVSLLAGTAAFRLALRRELRRGTVNLY